MKQKDLTRWLAQSPEPAELDALEEREVEVVSLLSRGLSRDQVCMEMGINAKELGQIKSGLQKKAGLRNDAELLQFARRQGS